MFIVVIRLFVLVKNHSYPEDRCIIYFKIGEFVLVNYLNPSNAEATFVQITKM